MILLAGFRSDAPAERNTEQAWRLLARQHPESGVGDAAKVVSSGRLSLGATGTGNVLAGAGGRLAVAVDARFDDRVSLCAALDRPLAASSAELVLAAWLRWGIAAPRYLYGDYAFAVWDSIDRRLFLVRDALGMRPLFFLPDGCAFASRADAFDILDPRYGRPAADALATHLAFARLERTSMYHGVAQVDPGELVTIAQGRALRTQWWRPSTRPDRRRNRTDTVAACRQLLDAAVADRVNGADAPIAAHLSAGLDSSVVTALASRLRPDAIPVHAFTAIPCQPAEAPGRLADEGAQAALAAAALPGVRHHKVTALDDPLSYFATAAEIYQQPLPNPHNHGWVAAINDAARAAGAAILLVGQTGNFSFSMPGAPHLRAKQLAKAMLRPFLRRPPLLMLATPHVRRRLGGNSHFRDGAERRLLFLLRLNPGAMLKGAATAWGLDWRDPLADRRLVEFSLTVPDRMLVALGDRGLGRPVAAELLPPEFVQNRARGYQAADWIERLRRHAGAVQRMIAANREHPVLSELLDLDAVAVAGARLEHLDPADPVDQRMYRVELPRALSVMAFVGTLAAQSSRSEAKAWQGARL